VVYIYTDNGVCGGMGARSDGAEATWECGEWMNILLEWIQIKTVCKWHAIWYTLTIK